MHKNIIIGKEPILNKISVIYFTHPNLMSENMNNECITAMSINGHPNIEYDNDFLIRSLSPTVKLEFFVLDTREKMNNGIKQIYPVKRQILPKYINIIIGLYEDFY